MWQLGCQRFAEEVIGFDSVLTLVELSLTHDPTAAVSAIPVHCGVDPGSSGMHTCGHGLLAGPHTDVAPPAWVHTANFLVQLFP